MNDIPTSPDIYNSGRHRITGAVDEQDAMQYGPSAIDSWVAEMRGRVARPPAYKKR